MSIIIVITYTWHRTVRSHCVFTFSILTDVIFRTELVFYFDWIVGVTCLVCFQSLLTFTALEDLMPHNFHDRLRTLCERIALLSEPGECLLNGHSKCARFYRWATNMKKEWSIEQEKLIITFIVEIVTSVFLITYMFILYPYLYRKNFRL
jgi:hypothetical protein